MIRSFTFCIVLLSCTFTTPAQDSDYWKTYKKRSDAPIASPKTSSIPVETPTKADNKAKTPLASDKDKPSQKATLTQGLNIYQSPEITALSERFKAENSNGTKLKGYKVQVFFGERNRANGIKAEFEISYPTTPADVTYLAPNFRVRVGNFRSNLDAERFLREIKGVYSNAYIVPDEIDLPSIN